MQGEYLPSLFKHKLLTRSATIVGMCTKVLSENAYFWHTLPDDITNKVMFQSSNHNKKKKKTKLIGHNSDMI